MVDRLGRDGMGGEKGWEQAVNRGRGRDRDRDKRGIGDKIEKEEPEA